MTDNYDVIIAGAGPAGGQAARDLAARGYDVCVLETESEDEFPSRSNKSTAGTFPSTMASFNIPDEVVMNFTDDVVLESPNDYYHRHQPGAVLEFADFKNWLVDAATADGAEYRFDARVSKPIMEGGEIVGVRYNGDKEVYADIVIDATGPSAPLAKALDVCDLDRQKQAIGIEFEFEGMDLAPEGYGDLTDAMMLRLDHDIAPGGYSWIFHTGGDTAKVGVCYIQNEGHRHNAKSGYTIDDYLQYWLDTDPRFANAERIEGKQHRGSAHIQLPGRMSTDNFMAIGDTVPTVDPLWGEGIDKCMRSGRAAAATADRALTNSERDTSASELAVYDQLWHERVAPKVKNRLFMTEMLYRASNERYDKLLADLHRLPNEQLDAANGGSPLAMFRMLKFEDLSILASTARDWFSN
ncbi:digeranylgeranylglycerophospholipid reductase [Haloferax marisrubri]|uniref:NAD(P)/FAD-dependent oxidoreductase n=1 Tax=Haloferax marisrubri TaxID=1544719 RepID=A0A2P4NQ50_9EURY|nr:digeranylgeranylglycerophospholipid reductase [Haloferax marisrubri]POG55277.1 NAD(P)/FAD-dependent oxidoreductase [Haloferax marisrubri]